MSIQQRIIVSRPGGLTVPEYKRRACKTSTEKMASNNRGPAGRAIAHAICWLSVGLNTSGPLSGLRASSFNNPIAAPPVPKVTKRLPFRKLIHDKLKNVENIINNKAEGILSSCRPPTNNTSTPIGLCLILIGQPSPHNLV